MASVDFPILLPAFLAGLLVLSTHVPLGQLVLERGIVFIDLAIAQVAGLGVVTADTMGWEAHSSDFSHQKEHERNRGSHRCFNLR